MKNNGKQPREGVRARRATVALVGALLLPCFSGLQAAAPGTAQIESHIHQPLRVRIPLHAVGPDDVGQLDVRVAPDEHYRAADIAPPPFLDEMSVDLRVEGDRVSAYVTSRTPVREPFLRLMIEIERNDQRLVRDYTLLLDPPPAATAQAESTETPESAPATGAIDEATEETAPQPVPDRPDVFGPVAHGTSLWQIADAVRPPGISVYQAMVVLFRQNPEAFADGDPGHLRAGVELAVPAADAFAALPHAEAVTAYQSWLDEPPPADPAPLPTLVAESLADIPAPESPAAQTEAEAELPRPAIEALAGYSAAEPLMIADNGGAREIGPIESRLDRIESRLAELEEGLVGETGATLSDQSASLERLEQRLAGIDTRLAEMADHRQFGGPAGYPPAAIIAGIAVLTFLLGLLAGRLLAGRSSHAGVAAVTIPTPTIGQPLWRRLGSMLRRSTPEHAYNREQTGTARRTRRGEAIPLSGGAMPPDASGIEASEEEETTTSGEAVAEAATAAEPATVQSEPFETRPAETADEDRDEPPATAVDLDALPPAPDPDDPVSLADLYLVEDLPRDAADLLRSAIASNADAPATWWLKLLDCLRLADDRTAFFEEARRFLETEPDTESWNDVLALARAFDPEHTLPREIPGAQTGAASRGHPDEDTRTNAAADAGSSEPSAVVVPEPDAPTPEARQEVEGAISEPSETEESDGTIEFDLPDLPDLDDARPVHGGAPAPASEDTRVDEDEQTQHHVATGADESLFDPGSDSIEEIELSDADPDAMPRLSDDMPHADAETPDTATDEAWEVPDEASLEEDTEAMSFDELEREFRNSGNADAFDESNDEGADDYAGSGDAEAFPDLDDLPPVDDTLRDAAAVSDEAGSDDSVVDFDTMAAELEATHDDADTPHPDDGNATEEDAPQQAGARKRDRRASQG